MTPLENNSGSVVEEKKDSTKIINVASVVGDTAKKDSTSYSGIFTGEYVDTSDRNSDTSKTDSRYQKYVFGKNSIKKDSSSVGSNSDFDIKNNLDIRLLSHRMSYMRTPDTVPFTGYWALQFFHSVMYLEITGLLVLQVCRLI
jgi:aryl-phospho-beta-D-glucosidase BglC (GH1 family)